MRPARSMSWWLRTSASAGVSFRVLMGYCERRIARHLSRSPLIRFAGGDAHPARHTPARPRDLPAAEPADHGMPVLVLLCGGGADRQAFRAGRYRGVVGDGVRYARWAYGTHPAHRDCLREGIRQ